MSGLSTSPVFSSHASSCSFMGTWKRLLFPYNIEPCRVSHLIKGLQRLTRCFPILTTSWLGARQFVKAFFGHHVRRNILDGTSELPVAISASLSTYRPTRVKITEVPHADMTPNTSPPYVYGLSRQSCVKAPASPRRACYATLGHSYVGA